VEPLIVAMAVVAISELGDKTQLVALVLANRFRRPLSIAAALVVAMTIMHALAAFGGAWLDRVLPDQLMAWLVGLGFCLMAIWMIFSDEHDRHEVPRPTRKRHAFAIAVLVFLTLEFGDKSQLATVGLAIALEPAWMVGLGAILGSTLVNLPVIWMGYRLNHAIPHRLIRWLAIATFAGVGLTVLARQAMAVF